MVTYLRGMDDAFRALADPTRRLLLDRLFERDGQTLGGLTDDLSMTRFGAMKHLRVLEGAGLIHTRRIGREKLHYLNPVPIQLIHDRWVSKYAEPWAQALGHLKRTLEAPMMTVAAPTHVYEIYIRATPERIWQAITDPDETAQYYYGTRIASTFRPGEALTYAYPDGSLAADGEVVEVDAPRRLVHTFRALWTPELAAEKAHTVTWELTAMGDATRLVVSHTDFEGETATYRDVAGGMSVILSGLKTLVETGESLDIGDPS
jgi:uncharacterized protein YndB with AHSA1/START domain/DNA-binding transcriptional ArsR family regulator